MQYNLELERVIKQINQSNARLVLIQLPDGLKKHTKDIQRQLEKSTKAKTLFWASSCFGACDIPNLTHLNPKPDLLIQFGHEEFVKTF